MKTKKQIEGLIKVMKYNCCLSRKMLWATPELEKGFMDIIKTLLWVIEDKNGSDIPEHYERGEGHSVEIANIPDYMIEAYELEIERDKS